MQTRSLTPYPHTAAQNQFAVISRMTTEENQKRSATCTLVQHAMQKTKQKPAPPQICHLILNKITFTRLPLHKKTSASSHRRCEDESANSVGMLWRVGKHGSVNEPTGSGATERRHVCHLAVSLLWLQRFIPPVNDETRCELCRKEESVPDPSWRRLLN